MENLIAFTVCLYPGVTALDFQGPIELLRMGSKDLQEIVPELPRDSPDVSIKVTFLSHDTNPVIPIAGAKMLPDAIYDDVKEQFDIVLIPGGEYK